MARQKMNVNMTALYKGLQLENINWVKPWHHYIQDSKLLTTVKKLSDNLKQGYN